MQVLQPVEREVVNPVHRVLSPTVNHVQGVERERWRQSFSVEKKKINKTISYKWLLNIMVPTLTGKPGKMESIFQLGNFEHTGKVREFYTKYWKSQRISDNSYFNI